MKLDLLKPQVIEVELTDHLGNSLGVIKIMPLSYTEWNNVAVGLDAPARRARLVPGAPEEDITGTPEYQAELNAYYETLNLRRVAKALDGGGDFSELKGKALDEQVEMLRGLDSGAMTALLNLLGRLAQRKSAEMFQPSVPENNRNGAAPKAVDAGEVAKS